MKGDSGEAYNVADSGSNMYIKMFAVIIFNRVGKKVVMSIPEEEEKRGYNVVKESVFLISKYQNSDGSPN